MVVPTIGGRAFVTVMNKEILDIMIMNCIVADFVRTVVRIGIIVHYILEMVIPIGMVTQVIHIVAMATQLDDLIKIVWICTIRV